MKLTTVFVCLLTVAVFAQTRKAPARKPATTAWTQWGGPNRNFIVESGALADAWPETGPKVIWRRPLGEGYSSVLAEDGILYTMHGRATEEVVVAIDAATGKTLWEYAASVTFRSEAPDMGNGPRATPLLVGNRLFTIGATGRLQCLDKKTGKLIWSHHLWLDYGGSRLVYGYASSPLAYRDLVLVPVGGSNSAMAAFRQSDGKLVWKQGGTFGNAYSSPVLINVSGLDQATVVMDDAVIAVNPLNGDLQWRVNQKTDFGLNISSPLPLPGNLVFVSAAYNAGSRLFELRRDGLRIRPMEIWYSNKLRIHHGNAIPIGDLLVFSNGDKGPAPLTCIRWKTGEVLWQDRAFNKSTLLWADDKLIILDTDGDLALARPDAKGVNVIARHGLMRSNAWTPPTLVGSRIYLRDRYSMMAVELGGSRGP